MNELERLKKVIREKRDRIAGWKNIEWYSAMDATYEQIEVEIDERLADYNHMKYFGY